MKKISSVLFLGFSAVSLVSFSSCSKDNRTDITFGDMNADAVKTIEYKDLKEKVDSEENFLVAVQYSDSCSCWSLDAKPVIEQYIKEKHVPVYHIKLEDLDAKNNRFDIKIITGNASFAIFEDGKVKHCITTSEDKTLKNYSAFESYMSSVIRLPKMYYVSKNDVDNMYKTEATNVIYFARNRCGDCSYFEAHFLKDWSKNNPGYARKIYVLDCDQVGIRLDEKGYNETQWFKFKDDYGLSKVNNPIYGFDGGYVPSLFLVKGSASGVEYKSGLVVFNDSLEKVADKYIVSNSYFTNERKANLQYIDSTISTPVLKGLEVKEQDDITIYGTWAHEASEKYFNPLAEKFLSYVENK